MCPLDGLPFQMIVTRTLGKFALLACFKDMESWPSDNVAASLAKYCQ